AGGGQTGQQGALQAPAPFCYNSPFFSEPPADPALGELCPNRMKTWNCVLIVGVGLIGGSVGVGVGKRKLARRVLGTGSRAATLQAALEVGAIDEVAAELKSAAAQADLVVVCAPVDAIVPQVRQLASLCRPGTLITDAGSTKGQIVAE